MHLQCPIPTHNTWLKFPTTTASLTSVRITYGSCALLATHTIHTSTKCQNTQWSNIFLAASTSASWSVFIWFSKMAKDSSNHWDTFKDSVRHTHTHTHTYTHTNINTHNLQELYSRGSLTSSSSCLIHPITLPASGSRSAPKLLKSKCGLGLTCMSDI